jgi:hypothetical protein
MREERAPSFEPRAGYGLDEVDGVLGCLPDLDARAADTLREESETIAGLCSYSP